jgi:hypothetical protein
VSFDSFAVSITTNQVYFSEKYSQPLPPFVAAAAGGTL